MRQEALAFRLGYITFYAFFAGGDLARTGLGNDWTCLFANDISAKKAEVYRANFGSANYHRQ